ncbi:MAG: DUF169 domain-containing protein [Candidatus Baldrarchaeia archaeon]
MSSEKNTLRNKSIELETLLRLRTPPIAVKFLEDVKFPKDTIQPSKMGIKITVCQAMAAARYLFRTVGMTFEDNECPSASLLFGWASLEDEDPIIEYFLSARYVIDEKAARELANKIPRVEEGKYPAVVFAPLRRCTFNPDVVVIYGIPAQIGRLVIARNFLGNGTTTSELISMAASCGEGVIKPFLRKDCTVTIPGAGDRVFASIDDDEIIFSMHGDWLDKIIDSLKNVGRGVGMRYPIPRFVTFKPILPPQLDRLRSKLKPVKKEN